MKRPLIGLTGRRKTGADIVDNIAVMAGADIDLYYSDYARAVWAAGGVPVHLPFDVPVDAFFDHLDGMLLSGGADVGPEHYGAEPETDMYPPEAERDRYELDLLDRAVDAGLATLGICRGIQIINVHGGGTLHQHIPEHARYDVPSNTEIHTITIEPGTKLGDMYGSERTVNSLHHQTIDRVAPGFRVAARSDDGTVEGLEHEELPIVAVQWHPEMMDSAATDPVFSWLVQAALLA